MQLQYCYTSYSSFAHEVQLSGPQQYDLRICSPIVRQWELTNCEAWDCLDCSSIVNSVAYQLWGFLHYRQLFTHELRIHEVILSRKEDPHLHEKNNKETNL